MRVVFMGTPEFAVPSFHALLDHGYDVVAACTQPDRPAGRGKRLTESPIKLAALARGVQVYQFERIRRREGLEVLEALKPDLFVTAAFGQILSERLLAIPPLGTINVHASLLPAYRGAAPINWCIALGEKTAGVTTMFTDAGIDTGDMALSASTPIGDMETAGELTERLARIGAELLIDTLRRLEDGSCPRTPQNEALSSHQPMLSREDGLIDWHMSAHEIACRVRGFNPWPGAFTYLPDGSVMKLWLARPVPGHGGQPGEVIASSAKQGLIIACGDGALDVIQMQAPGAKKMDAKAYLMGKSIPLGTIFAREGSKYERRTS